MSGEKKASISTKRFYSPTDFPVQVHDSTGVHIAYVKPEGSDLHQRFWTMALQKGCAAEGFQIQREEEFEELDPVEELKEILLSMIRNPQEGDFTASGLPDLRRLVKKAGYNVPRTEMIQAWNLVQQDVEKLPPDEAAE
ncbi:hypothetical protein [Massilia sp. NP310]|uniref:hypothetical protein n=1 Tax=Massilia sp. NP310 TaxID=2861282 RepID=UPI001C635EDA|nr:hypothetical protein [Massilia sp. NP310]QYG04013.1 hypothetical protein KY496_11845 [Massilia sp. NP310]